MTQQQLTEYNLGKTLDSLMNLDPRGYGVCNILYDAAYQKAGSPLSMHSARHIIAHVKKDSIVYIITGFVLRSYEKAETDGPIGALALARALVVAFDAKPIIVCPEEALGAVERLAAVMGLHSSQALSDVQNSSLTVGILVFSKEVGDALPVADLLIANARPDYAISIEAPGANEKGVYHNAVGLDVSALEAKSDLLFSTLQRSGVPTLAIGDLGNECGMGALKATIDQYIPYAAAGSCKCGCGGGIAAVTAADEVLTATVSNWGAYAISAALGYLTRNTDAIYTPELEDRALLAATEAGLIDVYGWRIPAVDGINATIITSIVTLMRECVLSTLKLAKTCAPWFEKTIELGFFTDVLPKNGGEKA
jgi:hypothetical protein